MNTNTKRLFVAIPIDQTFSHLCENFINCQNTNVIRWIKNNNWHITLLFLGNFPSVSIKQLDEELKKTFSNRPFFNIEFDGFYYIPNQNRPQMIWGRFFDSEEYHSLLTSLYKSLKQFYKANQIPFGIRPHRKSIPHITLCRLKKNFQKYNDLVTSSLSYNNLNLNVSGCQLIESVLKPGGAEYNMISEYQFINE